MFKSCLASIRRGLAKYLRKIRTTDLSPKRDLFFRIRETRTLKTWQKYMFFFKETASWNKKSKT